MKANEANRNNPEKRRAAKKLIAKRNAELREVEILLTQAMAISEQWPRVTNDAIGSIMTDIQSKIWVAHDRVRKALDGAVGRENNENYISNLAAFSG